MNTHKSHILRKVSSKYKGYLQWKKYIVYIAAILLTAILSSGWGSNFAAAKNNTAAEVSIHKYYSSIKLKHGDTLWDIADTYMDDNYDSVYEYIKELKEINGLSSDDIQAGQYLTIIYHDI